MYHFTVQIPNPPLRLQRSFTLLDVESATAFAAYLYSNGVKYVVRHEAASTASEAMNAVKMELAWAAEGRFQ